MPERLDLDRGVKIRTHPDGTEIAMYKDDPGKYYDKAGNPTTQKRAWEAGYREMPRWVGAMCMTDKRWQRVKNMSLIEWLTLIVACSTFFSAFK